MLSRNLKIILIFTLLDLLAIYCYLLFLEGTLTSRFFHISRDRGFSELISYFKFILIISCLYRLYKPLQDQLIRAWLIFFAVLTADDSLGLHEIIGKGITKIVHIPEWLPISAKNISELIGFAMLEGLALLNLIRKYFTTDSKYKVFTFGLLLSLIPLMFSGIILDTLPYDNIEQIGEIIGATIVLCYVLVAVDRLSFEAKKSACI